jgi:hypothetical protein
VVWPVDADVVDLILAAAELNNPVDDAPGGRRPALLASPYPLPVR